MVGKAPREQPISTVTRIDVTRIEMNRPRDLSDAIRYAPGVMVTAGDKDTSRAWISVAREILRDRRHGEGLLMPTGMSLKSPRPEFADQFSAERRSLTFLNVSRMRSICASVWVAM